jgi:hypothetical protein
MTKYVINQYSEEETSNWQLCFLITNSEGLQTSCDKDKKIEQYKNEKGFSLGTYIGFRWDGLC